MPANKLQNFFFFFSLSSSSIDPALSVTHPSLSTPPPSGTSETPGRRQPLQRPITPLIAYQIQFGIAVNEAKCSLLCVCVCMTVCVCVWLCEAWRSVLPLSSPISGIETPNCRAPTRLPSKIFLCLSNQTFTHTHTHTHIQRHTHRVWYCDQPGLPCGCSCYTYKHRTACCLETFLRYNKKHTEFIKKTLINNNVNTWCNCFKND